jgi:DHA1 family tetracycline resistance protein-like MFS transporter
VQHSRAALGVLFGVVIVDLVGFGIVIPVLPFYAMEYGASATTVGFLLMVYAAAQFVFAPLWGRLSDRIGRRPVMLFTVAGTAVSLALLGFADSLPMLFAARVLGGVFAANISVASAYITDVTAEEDRTVWMGRLGACFGIGFVIGPAIGGGLSPLGYSVPMLVAAGIGALNWGAALFALKEPNQHRSGAAATTRAEVLQNPLVRRMCLANLAFSLAVTQLETVFAFLMFGKFGYDAAEVAVVLVAMAVVMGGIQGGGMRALSTRYPETGLLAVGSLVLGAAFVFVPFAPTVGLLMIPLFFSAAGRAIAQPSLMSLVSLEANSDNRGAVMGAFQSAGSLARVLGPAAAGALYDLRIFAPFLLAAVLLVGVAWLAKGLPAREAAAPAPAV